MNDSARQWFAQRSSRCADWPLDDVRALKGQTTISVALPALNEAATVGSIVDSLRRDLVDVSQPLVDELIVVDSGSTDDTADVARAAGASVVACADVMPQLPTIPGKGEALWRALAATSGDIIVYVDADLTSLTSSFVTALVGPLLADTDVKLVKATYDRPLNDGARVHPGGGGRVTELVARPLLNLHWPDLAGFAQPLAGEYAGRRELLEQLPFATGYGVEIGLLIDAYRYAGLSALAQVDLGVRRHRHHDDQRLGRMAAEIWQTALARLGLAPHGLDLSSTWTQFVRTGSAVAPVTYDITALERPPMVDLDEYDYRKASAQ
jgi:glucosyl-3-phosphoglycerate synthase